jgi:hypothetical protein
VRNAWWALTAKFWWRPPFLKEGPVKTFSLLLLLAVPASALAAAQPPDDKSVKQERTVCKPQYDTWSRIVRARICRKAGEWSAQREQARTDEQAIVNLPFDHAYKAQLGNGAAELKGPK